MKLLPKDYESPDTSFTVFKISKSANLRTLSIRVEIMVSKTEEGLNPCSFSIYGWWGRGLKSFDYCVEWGMLWGRPTQIVRLENLR